MSIWFIFALTLFHETALSAARVVLVLFAVKLGASPFTVGILAAAFSLFPALLAVHAGRMADRFGARRPLVFASVCATLGMLAPYLVPGVPAIFVAAAMIGLFDAIFVVSLQSQVGLLSTPQSRARNYSNYSLIASAAALAGPLIAGFSIDFSGHLRACVYVVPITLAPLLMLALRGDALRGGVAPPAQAKQGAASMLARPAVRSVLVTSSIQSAANNMYLFYLPVYAQDAGLSASMTGVVLALHAAAMFVVRAVMPHLVARYGEEKVLAYAMYISSAGLLLMPFFQNPWMLALLSFVFGLGVGCAAPIITMLMFIHSAEGRSGEGMGLKITVNHLTKTVSPVVFGAIGSALGVLPIFVLNALMMTGAGVLGQRRVRRGSADRGGL